MKTKQAVWLAFLLNLALPLLSLLRVGFLDPVRSWLIPSMIWEMRLLLGFQPFLECISNREEDSHYTLGYKRFSLLGAMVTAVILMTGSGMVILENTVKLFHPQPVNEEGLLWLGIIASV